MSYSDREITAEDHGFNRAAATYFQEKSQLAEQWFDSEQLQAFRSFRSHWEQYFAPSDPARLSEYLALPFEMRKARFERFRRECRAWEVNFDLAAPTAGPTRRVSSDSEVDELRQRLEDSRRKEDQVRSFYDGLDSLLDRERQRRAHPLSLLPYLRILELPSDATLEDVKRQYKRLAKVHHPDRQGDATAMGKLSEAYRAILDFYKVA